MPTNRPLVKIWSEALTRWSSEEAKTELQRILNKRLQGESPGDGLPAVPTPPMFRPYPQTIGGPRLNNAVKAMLKLAPELQGQFNSIGYAPTKGVMDVMDAAKIPIEHFANTNLDGATEWKDGHPIYINPGFEANDNRGDIRETVGHEMAHAVGENEGGAQLVEALLRRYFAGQKQ